jgi:hypothetical protein
MSAMLELINVQKDAHVASVVIDAATAVFMGAAPGACVQLHMSNPRGPGSCGTFSACAFGGGVQQVQQV